MRSYFIYFWILIWSQNVAAQKYSAEHSSVIFFSDAAIEDIKGINTKAQSIFVKESGDVAFSIPIKDFEFEKALMKEHFNEKYMETDKFAKSSFQGNISGYQPNVPGEQNAEALGKITIHGVTKELKVPGSIEFREGKVFLKSKFMVRLEDYNIKIPQLLWKNVAEEVEVTIEFTYKQL